MNNTLKQVFSSGKFLIGFGIFMALLLVVIIYPLAVPHRPLEIIGQGNFFEPGVYVNVYDAIDMEPKTLELESASQNRIGDKLNDKQREDMQIWLESSGVPAEDIDTADTEKLLDLWNKNYNPDTKLPGMTFAKQRYYQRLDASLAGLLSTDGATIASINPETGALEESKVVDQTDFVNVAQVPNVRTLPLGTDNFGRDVLTELVAAIGFSLQIGFVAGLVATAIGLTLGLLAGYIGGLVDDVITFITNLFTVIPAFVLLILISYSIGQEARGAFTIAAVIGLTSWVWTARAVRAQVVSLRNRDHVNLSKLSGHSIVHIIINDILPYIASYVIMALILQIASGILAEAQLSILGLGPRTTEVPTLGLMMNWALIYQAPQLDYWWAYMPVLITIALITFSMNLMNTGLDQVFNPALRN